QRIRSDREVDLAVDVCVDIHQTLHEPITWCPVSFSELGDHFAFITPIMVDRRFRIPLDMRQQLVPDALFVMHRVCPQGVISLAVTLTYQQTCQVMETLIGYPLKVQEEFGRMPCEFWECVNINFAGPYGQGLEFDVEVHGLPFHTFSPSSRLEHIGQLV